jgi:alkyl hydroperoxide reductase subunit AhpC
MFIQLGDTVPDFEAETTKGHISLYEYLGNNWGILFSHPADFTPVCTTELGTAARLKQEFDARGVKMLALSVDSLDSHNSWIKDINETQQVEMNFPIIADPDLKIARLYGFIHPNASDKFTVRSVVIINPQKKASLLITYPASTGRNFNEILRVIDSLQLTEKHQVATPANWQQGQDVVILPSVRTEEIPGRFPKGHQEIKSYLRTTPQPD